MNDATQKARLKPVKLQVNTSGAWKDVTHFDAVNDIAAMHIMDAANTLGDLDAHNVKYRIATDEPLPQVLKTWDKANGWRTSTC